MNPKLLSKNFEFQWGERHSAISAEYWAGCYGAYAFGRPKRTNFIEIASGNYLHTYASRPMLREWKILSEKLIRPHYQKKILVAFQKVRHDYWHFYRTFAKTDLKQQTNRDLFLLLRNYYRILQAVGKYFVVSQPEGLDALIKTLEQGLKKKRLENLFSILITATTPDIIFQEQRELKKIACSRHSESKLLAHALKHAWLFFNSYDTRANLRYLKKRFGEKFHAREFLQKKHQLRLRQRIIFKGMADPRLKAICLFLQRIANERLELKNCWAGAEFRFLPLFQTISTRIKVPFLLMISTYTLNDYARALLEGERITTKQIVARRHSFVFWHQNRQSKLIEDEKTRRSIIKILQPVITSHRLRQLQGTPAHPGLATGRCRLVKSINIAQLVKDLKKFKRGDILVTWMTQPNMVPLVERAAAIIADEGGMTSHAAVIAREFNIPCIVGTKFATKELCNGQKVSVDANRGIITKLK